MGIPFYFLRFPNVFINFHEYANLIISIHYRWRKLLCLTFVFFIELVLKDEFLLRYKFVGICPTVLKRIVCCNGNHAYSHSSKGVIFRAILLSIEGGPTKQFDAHEKLS